jgi:Xaa-Pro aminopeptidase
MTRNRPEPGRIRRLHALMAERRIDAFLVCQRENVRYLTGFSGSSGCVLVFTGRPVLITDFRYETQAGRESPHARILIQKKDLFTTIADAASDLGVRKLWFDESSMTVDRLRLLKKQGLQMMPAKDSVSVLRLRKDSGELRSMKKAIRRAEESFEELVRTIKPGTTERALGLRLEWLMREKGSRKAAFDTIVASGRNGAMPHASVSNRTVRAGDLVTFDFGAEADGYFCDITRTICIGRPTARQMQMHDLVRRAQQAAIDAIKPGVACSVIDRAARDLIEKAGQGKHFGHATGHGIGLMVHEGPSISALSKSRVQGGMIFTVEPGVYIPGWGGVRIEDMVHIADSGARVMTTLSRDLLIRKT